MASGTNPRGRQASLREIRANMGGAWFQAASYGDGRPRGPQGRLLEWDCADPEGGQLLVVVDSVDPAVRARWIADLSEAFRSFTGKTEDRLRDALTHARPYLSSAVMLALNHRLQGHLAWIGRPAVFRARGEELEDLIDAPATSGVRLREVSARTGDRVLLISRPVPDRPHDVTRALALPTPILALERLLRVVYPFAQVNGMVLQAAILGRSLASTPASARARQRRVLAPALKAIGHTAALAAVAFVGGAATWMLFAFASQYASSFRFEQRAGTVPSVTASATEPLAASAPTEAVAAELQPAAGPPPVASPQPAAGPPPATPVETIVAEAPKPEPVAPPPPSKPLESDRDVAQATPPPAPRSEETRKPAPAARPEPSRVETRVAAAPPAPAPPAASKSAPKPVAPTARVTPQPRPMPEPAPVIQKGDAVALGTPTRESVVRVERRELAPEVVEPAERARPPAAPPTLSPGTPLDRLRAGAFLEQWSLAIASTDHELYETLGFEETRGLFNRRYRGRQNQALDFKDLDVKRAADGELRLQVRSLYRYRDGAGSHHIERLERIVLRETPDGVLRYVGTW